jgi:hypothetical protein
VIKLKKKRALNMLNLLQSNHYCHHLQVNFAQLNRACHRWYKLYAPATITQRPNINQAKVSDSTLIALLICQAQLGIESQRRFCMILAGSISRSRYNRRTRQLLPLLNLIRRKLNQEVNLQGQFLIIDSFPVPLCQPIRNRRAKLFQGIADIGYNATKKQYYYGFKVHMIVSSDGYLLNYLLTKASVHDTQAAEELILDTMPLERFLLADVGYVSRQLHACLESDGYELWTPFRRNMAGAREHNSRHLKAIRRTIETDFSLLNYYNAENNRARSLVGFQERLEVAILASNIEYCLEKFH